ncbi:hypothetical protein [Candidatus Neptunichlamydia sp. REUL1]|uniref:hypothetical protein n=1 Tax=Candidatus Neptunichlamydia sp. REUL1 TaxID=3064277 RepID=UPI00292F2113|nr:hypothetical protein [Candidatus Neptunochlamydia sp. REUL1]
MKDKKIYKGFNIWAEGKGSESYFIGTSNSNNTAAETIVLKSTKKANTENWEKADREKHVETAHNIYRKLVGCIKQMEPFHLRLAPFLAEAMEVFAENNLS